MNSQDEVIRISWEEWKAGRAAKRETLRKLGLDAPSRRPFGHDNRLRAAFGGERAPTGKEIVRGFDEAKVYKAKGKASVDRGGAGSAAP